MSIDIYKVPYRSKNLIEGEQANQNAGISPILQKARRNSKEHNITGTLLSKFAQVAQTLEGPRPERTTT
jgi:hypothetical protein